MALYMGKNKEILKIIWKNRDFGGYEHPSTNIFITFSTGDEIKFYRRPI